MKILVTGGAGFIGSHLAAKLLEENHELTIMDNLHPYYSPALKRQQLERIKTMGDFTFYNADLLHEEKVQSIFELHKFDAVVHLAALPGVQYSLQNPHEYVDQDIKATINVVKACGRFGVEHMIFASSSSVYGDRANVPLQEDMASGNVISPYAAAKYGAESFCQAYANIHGFELTILRFFTVYGPWGRPDMAIAKFISALEAKEEITIFGDGTARDYTYIDDIIQGVLLVLMAKSGKHGIYNLGSSRPVTLEELISYLGIHYPEMRIRKAPHRQGDVSRTWADITKARQTLGFNPTVGIEEGLYRTIQWARLRPYEV